MCYIAMERRPGEIIEFLHQHRDNHLQHCDVRAIRFDLEREHVISQGQREQLDNSLTVAAANDLFHQFLHKDPATKTLEAAAKVLKEAPNTTGMNKKFAKDIEDFLSLKVTSSGGYSYVCNYSMSDILVNLWFWLALLYCCSNVYLEMHIQWNIIPWGALISNVVASCSTNCTMKNI